jgi:hypothetical protein
LGPQRVHAPENSEKFRSWNPRTPDRWVQANIDTRCGAFASDDSFGPSLFQSEIKRRGAFEGIRGQKQPKEIWDEELREKIFVERKRVTKKSFDAAWKVGL